MAITFTTRDFAGVEKEILIVGETDTSDALQSIILKEDLMDVDLGFLAIVDAAETGTTLLEKMEVATINGRKAIELFASRVKISGDVTASARRRGVVTDVVGAIIELQDANAGGV